MKLIMPSYCNKFHCIADKCSDNCCIGWGIYIDDDTVAKYRTVSGNFGERLKKGIDASEQCFRISADKRCPFLNENGLCDIIIELGEDMLCDICDRHPRYFEWFDDHIEGGIGLSCEEAAKIILSADKFSLSCSDAPVSLCDETPDEYDASYYTFLNKARENIIALLLDSSQQLDEALAITARYAEILQDLTDMYEIETVPDIPHEYRRFDIANALSIMAEAEPSEAGQTDYFRRLSEYAAGDSRCCDIAPENEKELRNIAVYFIWRYMMKALPSGNLYPKIMFAVFGTRVINVMFNFEMGDNEILSFEKKCDAARGFSKLIEYNEDNLWHIFDGYEYT